MKEESPRKTSNGVWKNFVATLNEGISVIQSPNIKEMAIRALREKIIFKPRN